MKASQEWNSGRHNSAVLSSRVPHIFLSLNLSPEELRPEDQKITFLGLLSIAALRFSLEYDIVLHPGPGVLEPLGYGSLKASCTDTYHTKHNQGVLLRPQEGTWLPVEGCLFKPSAGHLAFVPSVSHPHFPGVEP